MFSFFRKKEGVKQKKTLNGFIAKAHQLQRKSIGLIVASGSILAFGLSFILIVLGIETTALLYPPTTNIIGQIAYAVVWIIPSIIIGILVERLTTTNSTKLRIMRENVEEIEARFLSIEEPTEAVKKEKDKNIKVAKKGSRSIISLIILGTAFSMMCESFFIHLLFTSWNPIVGWIASLFLSSLVSYTLISSELHKRQEAEVIRDSLNTDTFMGVAAQATIKDRVHERMLAQATVKVDEITDSEVLKQAIDQAVIKHVDEVMEGEGEIIERIADEREQTRLRIAQEKERTRQQLSIIRDGGQPEPLSTSAVVASFDNPQPQKSKNHLRIEEMYRQCGESYFTARAKNRLSRKMGITTRTIDRILTQIKEEEESA